MPSLNLIAVRNGGNLAGDDGKQVPKYKNDKEADRIFNLIMRFYNEVTITFEVAPKEFEPLFVEHEHEGQTLIDAEAWCWGFWEGMELRPGSWDPIWESEVAELMRMGECLRDFDDLSGAFR